MSDQSPFDPLPVCLGCWRERFGPNVDPGPPHRPPEVEACAVCGGPTNYGLYLLRGRGERSSLTMEDRRRRIGMRLLERRMAAGVSQARLARLLPGTVEAAQISRWERGESFPTYANVLALARALDISEDALIRGEDA